MRMEEVDKRKAYIQQVRKSFDLPERSYEFERDLDTKGEVQEGFSFFKVRLLVAAFIFGAYVLCDYTKTNFYQYSTKDVAKMIEQEFDYDGMKEKALQAFHQIQVKRK